MDTSVQMRLAVGRTAGPRKSAESDILRFSAFGGVLNIFVCAEDVMGRDCRGDIDIGEWECDR